MNVALPISFAQLDPAKTKFPNVAFTSSPPTMVDRSTEGRASRQGGPPVSLALSPTYPRPRRRCTASAGLAGRDADAGPRAIERAGDAAKVHRISSRPLRVAACSKEFNAE